MHSFSPISALIGGALIGLSATLLLAYHGRITGISGILDGFLAKPREDLSWRLTFLLGLVLTGVVAGVFFRSSFGLAVQTVGPGKVAFAGVLVGFGTRLGNGCTSGHGVVGLSRFSLRSLIATLTFIGTGILTTYSLHAGLGAP